MRAKAVQADNFSFAEKDVNAKEDKRTLDKEFVYERTETGLVRVRLTAGGEVPDTLKGYFTSINRARDAVANYEAIKRAG